MTFLNPCGCLSSLTKKFPSAKRLNLIEKCEEKFLAEIDIGTLIKRIRRSNNTLDNIQDRDLKRYLKLNKSNIIISDDDSQSEHDFEVTKGYFSSSSSEDESLDAI